MYAIGFFLPVGLLLKLVEHVQQHVHPPSIVCASNQYFVALRTARKVETGRAGHGMNFVRFAPIGHAFAGFCAPVLAFEPLLIDRLMTRILTERLDLRNFG